MMPSTTGTSEWKCQCGTWVPNGVSHSCNPSAPLPSIPLWPTPQGWQCPNCGSAHAPSVLTCPAPIRMTYGLAGSGGTS